MSDWLRQEAEEIFPTYQAFLAVSQHFAGRGYDYFKYNGKIRAGVESLMKNKTIKQFKVLHRKVKGDPVNWVVAQHFFGKKVSVFDCINTSAESRYQSWMDLNRDLPRVVMNDLSRILADRPDRPVMDLFKPNGQDYAPLLEYLLAEDISLLTVIAINKVMKLVEKWEEAHPAEDDFIWDNYMTRIQKLEGFVPVSPSIIQEVIVALHKESNVK